ncbi:MAG: nicotinate phosphoribosyltransferase [Candidatus Competibacteraceae bacterium]|jgi:nicotinate phosphoribosyltransferase|nr:nicotinate phosphoribosyltransferase [Candidatus Competibacteraceae bacterium]
MIINSLLDTDLYKFTMMQAVLHQFPGAQVEYRFKCRDADIDLRPFAGAIRDAISELCTLRFTEDELTYLSSLRFMKPDFVDFLRLFHLQTRYVEVCRDAEALEIILRGPWLHTILFEVPVLAIVNQIYFQDRQSEATEAEGWRRLQSKIETVRQHPETENFRFADFGTRRRFSTDWQRQVVAEFAKQLPENCVGTSNVLLAKTLGLIPIGTMAHEFLQACQALGPRLVESQKFAFETWAREYRGDLGIALSDVVGINAFLHDFDLYFCKLFDGARHDSGDPFQWADKVIANYHAHRVDPRHKNLVFSDGLNLPKALAIYDRFKDEARLSFGIGTNLTNDLGHKALNIVIKMTECNGQPVAKLSDSAGKTMCRDETFLAYLRQVFGIG